MKIIKPARRGNNNQKPSETSSYIYESKSSTKPTTDKCDRVSLQHASTEHEKQFPQLEPLSSLLDESLANADKSYQELLSKGIRLLAMREHSSLEIENKLSKSTDDAELIDAAINELCEKKYLSDERFAESFARSRFNRGYGPIRLKSELKQKGIKDILIAENLNQYSDLWFEQVQRQYSKKYGENPVSNYKEWSKRARFLQSRGFTSEQINSVVPSFDSNHDLQST